MELSRRSGLTTEQALRLGENIVSLLPVYGTPIALYQALTGESLSGQSLTTVERFFKDEGGAPDCLQPGRRG